MATPMVIINTPPVVRIGLTHAFAQADFTVKEATDAVASLQTGASAAAVVGVHQMKDLDLVVHLKAAAPDAVIVTLLDHASTEAYRASLRAGALAALPLDAEPADVVLTLSVALADMTLLPSGVARAFANSGELREDLSETEIGWLRGLASGLTVAGLADVAGYSTREMFRRLRKLYRRMGAANRTDALVLATRRGLLD